MKKSLFIIAATALVVGCASNDSFKEINNQEATIGFSSQYASNSTKAEITSAWIQTVGSNFGVYGYKTERNSTETFLYNNVQVTNVSLQAPNDVPDDWTYDAQYIRYWDKLAEDAYDFYAYAPYKASTTFARTGTKTGFVYKLDDQIFADATLAGTVDLCVSDVEDTDYAECYYPGTSNASDGHVSFIFNHVLSKLTFRVFKGENVSAAHGLTLTGLKVGFPSFSPTNTGDEIVWTQTAMNNNSGTVSYAAGTVTQPTTAGTTLLSNGSQNVTTTKTDITGVNSFIVTPNATSEQKHTIKIEVAYTLNYTHSDPADFTDQDITDMQIATGTIEQNFAEDTHYTISIKINPDKIDFDVDAVQGFTNIVDVETEIPE